MAAQLSDERPLAAREQTQHPLAVEDRAGEELGPLEMSLRRNSQLIARGDRPDRDACGRAIGFHPFFGQQQNHALQRFLKPDVRGIDDEHRRALGEEEFSQRLGMQDVQQFGGHHHRQPAARFEQGQRRDNEGNPGVRVPGEVQVELLKDLLGERLLFGVEILIADEGRIAEHGVERGSSFRLIQEPLEEIARVDLGGDAFELPSAVAGFLGLLGIQFATDERMDAAGICPAEGLDECTVATGGFKDAFGPGCRGPTP